MQVQTVLYVCQSNAVSNVRIIRARRQPEAAVCDAPTHIFAVPVDLNGQFPASIDLRKAVGKGVFNNRLQDHSRDQCIVQLRINGERPNNASCVPPVLHGEVGLNEFDFVVQGDELDVSPLQCHTEQAAHLFQHGVGGVDVAPHQAGDAVHGVEEEVRVQLHAQC